jgi:pimeloyl-ACP methyl ester carboxylesterase
MMMDAFQAMEASRSAVAVKGISTQEAGVGDLVLLFVHGFGCSLKDYAAQLDGLGGEFRCIALDLPGHGASELPAQPTIAALSAAVNAVKRASGAQRVVLVGHSLGAKVIREAYRQSRDAVAGLVFLDSSMYVGDADDLIARLWNQTEGMRFPAFITQLFDGMFFDDRHLALRHELVERALRMDQTFAQALLTDAIRWELTSGNAALRDITDPVLVLQSTYFSSDYQRLPLRKGIHTPFMQAVSEAVAQADIRTLTNLGHMPMCEAPSVVNEHIRDFVGKLH